MATLALENATLWYEERGEGRPLVFVHGGWLDGDAWRAQVDRFAGDYRTITLDLRGHGRTGPTDRGRYSVSLFTDDVEGLLDRLGVDRPILCGLSLGGMVVQTYLVCHPGRAAGAIIAGPVRSMPPVDLPAGLKPLVSPVPALAATLPFSGSQATFRSLLRSVRAATGGPWLTVDPSVREAAMASVGDVSPAEFQKIFGALYRFEPPSLSDVDTPTLVVYGEEEAAPVKRQGERLAETVEGTVTAIPDAGHLVNQDAPAAFDAAVAAFLDGLDASAD